MKYRIHWKAIKTDATGYGTGEFALSKAMQIVADLNDKNKDVTTHWIEHVDERAKKATMDKPRRSEAEIMAELGFD